MKMTNRRDRWQLNDPSDRGLFVANFHVERYVWDLYPCGFTRMGGYDLSLREGNEGDDSVS
jgi:hypothetical protein